MSFLGEIKRRKVFQVAAVYAVVAWLTIQIVGEVSQPLNLPDWLATVVIVLLAVGFPIAVILAWAFDLTPGGVVRDQGSAVTYPNSGRRIYFVLIGLLVVAVGWIIFRESGTAGSVAVDVLPNSVAVLPFENLSTEEENAHFAIGIHDTILNELAKIADVNVIARTSVLKYGDGQTSIQQIAEELNVQTVMEGTVQYAEGQVRVTAQLIDPATGSHLWSGNYDRPFSGIFAIQSEVASRIADALEAELLESEEAILQRQPTTSPEAYGLYLRAMALGLADASAILGDASTRSRVESLLDQAIDLDPDFAMARAQRANLIAVTLNSVIVADETYATRRTELEARAFADIEAALQIDPNLGAAYATLGIIHQYNWRGRDAEEAFERAVELSPSDSAVLSAYSRFSSVRGRLDAGLQYAQRAVELDPNSAARYSWLAVAYGYLGDLTAATNNHRIAYELGPIEGLFFHDMANVEILRGNIDAALEFSRIGETVYADNTNPMFLAAIGYTYGRLGQRDDAERVAAMIESLAAAGRVPDMARVYAHLARGEEEEALVRLLAMADAHEPYEGHYLTLQTADNLYRDPVMEQPEFVEVRSRLGFVD